MPSLLCPPLYSKLELNDFALLNNEGRIMSKLSVLSLLVCLSLAPASHAQHLSAAEMREKAAEEEMQRQELVNLQVKQCARFK